MRPTVDEAVANAKEVALGEGRGTPGAGKALDVVDVLVADAHHQLRGVDALAAAAAPTHAEQSEESGGEERKK